jgi:hypothetical protein
MSTGSGVAVAVHGGRAATVPERDDDGNTHADHLVLAVRRDHANGYDGPVTESPRSSTVGYTSIRSPSFANRTSPS